MGRERAVMERMEGVGQRWHRGGAERTEAVAAAAAAAAAAHLPLLPHLDLLDGHHLPCLQEYR